MKQLFLITICTLLVFSCKQQGQKITDNRIDLENDSSSVDSLPVQYKMKHGFYLEKDSGYVYCYAGNERIVLGDDYLDDGAMAMLIHQQGKYTYVIGDIVPNSDGWTVRFHLYRVDTKTLKTKHIGNFAAIHFEDNGFRAATTRQINPDATCTAEEVFLMRDNFYNYDGTLIRKGEKEYDYDEMIAQYSDSLVNANGYRYDM